MTRHVKVGEAKTHLSAILAEVEAGGEVIISRGDKPIARLSPIVDPAGVSQALEGVREWRKSVAGPTTAAEILAWRDEGRR